MLRSATLGALAATSARALDLDTASGLRISRNNSFVALGTENDIVMSRDDDGSLQIDANTVNILSTVKVEDLYIKRSDGTYASVADATEPTEAGTWTRAYTFGLGEICSHEELVAAGLGFDTEDDQIDEDCYDEHFGIWCPNGCTGDVIVPLDRDDSSYVRIRLGVSYDNDSCQGYLFHVNGETGDVTEIWTHATGTNEDAADYVVAFNSGDELIVTETGTCVVDIYYVDFFTPDIGDRVEVLEEQVSNLQAIIANLTTNPNLLALLDTSITTDCDWEMVQEFGVDDLCSTSEMEAEGWTFTDVNDDRCGDDYYGAWCGGDCNGAMQIELPEGYSAAAIVIGHSYGGSCQGYVNHYDADGTVSELFTHAAGEEFDPERIEFEYQPGDILEVIESNTCIIDLYSLSLLPITCPYVEPPEEQEWDCGYEVIQTFGEIGEICSDTELESAGWDLTDVNDDRCQNDNYGFWCGGDCDGSGIFELPSGYTTAKIVIGHSYGGSCQGFVRHINADGTFEEIFTHDAGETFDPEAIEFDYSEGDKVELIESSTCIIDLYTLSAIPETCDEPEDVDDSCDYEAYQDFGSSGICSTTDMTDAGWLLEDITDERCQDDNYGAWCPGSCDGYMELPLPDGYSSVSVVIGHSYGGSCQGFVNHVKADRTFEQIFTHGAGESFDPETITFDYEPGDYLEIIETDTCIIDIYSVSLRPNSC